MRHLSKFCVVLAVCAVLGGCGDASQPEAEATAPRAEHGIFISARDCASTGKLTIDQCGQAIDVAVARHEAETPTYGSLSQCEAKVGADRCDKGVDRRYRLRLQAFFVTLAVPAHAVPLYPPSQSMVGFQSPSKQVIDARDDTLRVSDTALALAYDNAKLKNGAVDAGAQLGSAAADIH
jgi:Protein of unknown function (DUF1190)